MPVASIASAHRDMRRCDRLTIPPAWSSRRLRSAPIFAPAPVKKPGRVVFSLLVTMAFRSLADDCTSQGAAELRTPAVPDWTGGNHADHPSGLYFSAMLREKRVLPIGDELARREAGQGMTLADEMRLIEIAGLVGNLGPGLGRSVATCPERGIEPDGSRIELGGQAHLGGETALKLTRAETRSLDQCIDAGAA